MALSKAQKAKLREAGMGKDELTKLEAILAADDGDADNGDKPSGSKRVVVYEGEDAESFMRGLMGGKEKDEDEEEEEEDEEEHEGDEAPKTGPRWFK